MPGGHDEHRETDSVGRWQRFHLDVSQYYVIRTIIIFDRSSRHGVVHHSGLVEILS